MEVMNNVIMTKEINNEGIRRDGYNKEEEGNSRIVSSGMLRRLALVTAYVSEEFSASFIRVTRIGRLGTTLAVTSNRCRLRRNAKRTSVASDS
jgi:hypothetical protein